MWHTWGQNEEQQLRFCKKSKTGLTGSVIKNRFGFFKNRFCKKPVTVKPPVMYLHLYSIETLCPNFINFLGVLDWSWLYLSLDDFDPFDLFLILTVRETKTTNSYALASNIYINICTIIYINIYILNMTKWHIQVLYLVIHIQSQYILYVYLVTLRTFINHLAIPCIVSYDIDY